MNNAMQGAPQIGLNNTTPIKCEKCESEFFVEAYNLRKASKLLTGTSKDMVVPIPLFRCADCGNVNEEFKPTK
jgi:uncharacterized Zn finger protein